MLTATTRWGIPSSEAMKAWRRVCSTTPLRASTSTMARSAVEAPVTMLRVYCTWPGRVGQDERAPRGGEVAVGDVDRDALLALGAQAVGQAREVELAVAPAQVVELVGEDRLGVVEQAPDERRLAVVDASRPSRGAAGQK